MPGFDLFERGRLSLFAGPHRPKEDFDLVGVFRAPEAADGRGDVNDLEPGSCRSQTFDDSGGNARELDAEAFARHCRQAVQGRLDEQPTAMRGGVVSVIPARSDDFVDKGPLEKWAEHVVARPGSRGPAPEPAMHLTRLSGIRREKEQMRRDRSDAKDPRR